MSSALRALAPWHVHRAFLDEAERAELLDWTIAHESDFFDSKVGPGKGELHQDVRASRTMRHALFADWAARLRARVDAILPELAAAVGIRPFPIGKFDVQLIAYGDGAFYRRHRDTPPVPDEHGVRVMTCVYYFHAEPRVYSGGELRLFQMDGDPAHFVDIAPEQNALAVFPSWAPHEVRPVSCPSGRFADSRFAVNCWVHFNR